LGRDGGGFGLLKRGKVKQEGERCPSMEAMQPKKTCQMALVAHIMERKRQEIPGKKKRCLSAPRGEEKKKEKRRRPARRKRANWQTGEELRNCTQAQKGEESGVAGARRPHRGGGKQLHKKKKGEKMRTLRWECERQTQRKG